MGGGYGTHSHWRIDSQSAWITCVNVALSSLCKMFADLSLNRIWDLQYILQSTEYLGGQELFVMWQEHFLKIEK